jgi:hypothetical protein
MCIRDRLGAMPAETLPDSGSVDLMPDAHKEPKVGEDIYARYKVNATKAATSASAPTTNASDASTTNVSAHDKIEGHNNESVETGFEDYSLEELEEFIVSEEYDQLDELSKGTLRSYLKGSRAENQGSLGSAGHMSDKARSLGRTDDDKDDARYAGGKLAKRKLGAPGSISPKVMAQNQTQKKMKEDVDALFADDSTISEEFKSKVSTIFEARVLDRIEQIEEEIEQTYADLLEQSIQTIAEDLTVKVDDYLNYVVEQWTSENEIAIESGLRSELTEDFISGLRNLFAEHYIDVPTEKVDLVDELASRVEELESKLNEEVDRGVQFAKALIESRKNEVTRDACDGLTETQVEKIKTLAESVEFSAEDEYKTKLQTIRENYFPSGVKKGNLNQLHEVVELAEDKKEVSNDPFVQAVSQAISKTKI